MRNFIYPFIMMVFILMNINSNGQQLAFPGAEGFGKYATGGRDGRIVEVTSLLDLDRFGNRYPGTLREALTTPGTDPITIVFRVSGIIELSTQEIKSSRPNMTIAGQTAPGDGICIKNGSIVLSGENLIIRYIRFRPGDELKSNVSGLNIENSKNIIVDHCSFSWAIEENVTLYDNKYTTVQWCIISEALYDSYNAKGPRAYAGQWGGQYASYHHNLIAHNNSRTPRINGSRSNDTIALVDLRNNIIYNWGTAGALYGGELEIFADDPANPGENLARCNTNVVNNYYKPGPATPASKFFAQPYYESIENFGKGFGKWYLSGNYMEGIENGMNDDNWLGVDASKVGSADSIKSEFEFEVDPVITELAHVTYESVLMKAGAILPARDLVDTRIVAEVRGEIPVTGSGIKGENKGIIDTQSAVGGWPEYVSYDPPVDSDGDGMPDYWEIENGLDPDNPDDGNDIGEDGYTNLEIYLNSLTGSDHLTPSTGIKNDAGNLLFRAFPNPATDRIYLTHGKQITHAKLFDSSGRLIVSTDKDYISLENLNMGLYILTVELLNGTVSNLKIIKK